LRRYFYVYFKTSGGGVTRTTTLSVVALSRWWAMRTVTPVKALLTVTPLPDDEIFVVVFQIGEEKSVYG
jgi:hypothetical protein